MQETLKKRNETKRKETKRKETARSNEKRNERIRNADLYEVLLNLEIIKILSKQSLIAIYLTGNGFETLLSTVMTRMKFKVVKRFNVVVLCYRSDETKVRETFQRCFL